MVDFPDQVVKNLSLAYYLNCLTTGKFLKFWATLLQAILEYYSELREYDPLVNISYDEDTNSIILTAVNGRINHIYMKLEDFIGLQNYPTGQISDGVTLIEKALGKTYMYYDLVFEKTK